MIPKKSTPGPSDRAAGKPLDPILEETIEEAMRPYVGVLPAAGLQTMRDALVDALTTHPDAIEAIEALRKEPVADQSGTRVRDGADDGETGGQEGVA